MSKAFRTRAIMPNESVRVEASPWTESAWALWRHVNARSAIRAQMLRLAGFCALLLSALASTARAQDASPSESPEQEGASTSETATPEAPAAPADAPVESPLPSVSAESGDFEVGFSASDGVYVRTRDRSWSIHLGLFFQFRLSVSSTPDPSRQFEFVPVTERFYLQGSIIQPWIRYFFQTEFAGQTSPAPAASVSAPNAAPAPAPRLLDFWVEAQPFDWLGARVGVMRPPMSRHWITGLQRQLMLDRSDSNLFFRTHGTIVGGSDPPPPADPAVDPTLTPALTVPWDRDVGAYVFGTPLSGVFEYYVGVFNGNGFLFGRNNQASAMPLVRFVVNPLGAVAYDETPAVSNPHQPPKVSIAASGYYNRPHVDYSLLDPAMPTPMQRIGNEEHFTFEADATLQIESVYVSGELYYRNRQTIDGSRHHELGGMLMAGWMFFAPYLEVAARASFVDPNLSTDANFRQIYDLALNGYVAGNNLRAQLRYTVSINDAPLGGGVPGAFIVIPPGTVVHTGSLWAQLYF